MPENADLRKDIGQLQTKIEYLTSELTELRRDTADMLEAWRASTGFFKFVKWFLSLAAAAAGLWAAITQIRWG